MIKWYGLLGTKWQHSQLDFQDFQMLILNKKDGKPREKMWHVHLLFQFYPEGPWCLSVLVPLALSLFWSPLSYRANTFSLLWLFHFHPDGSWCFFVWSPLSYRANTFSLLWLFHFHPDSTWCFFVWSPLSYRANTFSLLWLFHFHPDGSWCFFVWSLLSYGANTHCLFSVYAISIQMACDASLFWSLLNYGANTHRLSSACGHLSLVLHVALVA